MRRAHMFHYDYLFTAANQGHDGSQPNSSANCCLATTEARPWMPATKYALPSQHGNFAPLSPSDCRPLSRFLTATTHPAFMAVTRDAAAQSIGKA